MGLRCQSLDSHRENPEAIFILLLSRISYALLNLFSFSMSSISLEIFSIIPLTAPKNTIRIRLNHIQTPQRTSRHMVQKKNKPGKTKESSNNNNSLNNHHSHHSNLHILQRPPKNRHQNTNTRRSTGNLPRKPHTTQHRSKPRQHHNKRHSSRKRSRTAKSKNRNKRTNNQTSQTKHQRTTNQGMKL